MPHFNALSFVLLRVEPLRVRTKHFRSKKPFARAVFGGFKKQTQILPTEIFTSEKQ